LASDEGFINIGSGGGRPEPRKIMGEELVSEEDVSQSWNDAADVPPIGSQILVWNHFANMNTDVIGQAEPGHGHQHEIQLGDGRQADRQTASGPKGGEEGLETIGESQNQALSVTRNEEPTDGEPQDGLHMKLEVISGSSETPDARVHADLAADLTREGQLQQLEGNEPSGSDIQTVSNTSHDKEGVNNTGDRSEIHASAPGMNNTSTGEGLVVDNSSSGIPVVASTARDTPTVGNVIDDAPLAMSNISYSPLAGNNSAGNNTAGMLFASKNTTDSLLAGHNTSIVMSAANNTASTLLVDNNSADIRMAGNSSAGILLSGNNTAYTLSDDNTTTTILSAGNDALMLDTAGQPTGSTSADRLSNFSVAADSNTSMLVLSAGAVVGPAAATLATAAAASTVKIDSMAGNVTLVFPKITYRTIQAYESVGSERTSRLLRFPNEESRRFKTAAFGTGSRSNMDKPVTVEAVETSAAGSSAVDTIPGSRAGGAPPAGPGGSSAGETTPVGSGGNRYSRSILNFIPMLTEEQEREHVEERSFRQRLAQVIQLGRGRSFSYACFKGTVMRDFTRVVFMNLLYMGPDFEAGNISTSSYFRSYLEYLRIQDSRCSLHFESAL
jgi:hypothetical protein